MFISMCVELDSTIQMDIDTNALLLYLGLLGRNRLQTLEGELEKTAQKQVGGVARTNFDRDTLSQTAE